MQLKCTNGLINLTISNKNLLPLSSEIALTLKNELTVQLYYIGGSARFNPEYFFNFWSCSEANSLGLLLPESPDSQDIQWFEVNWGLPPGHGSELEIWIVAKKSISTKVRFPRYVRYRIRSTARKPGNYSCWLLLVSPWLKESKGQIWNITHHASHITHFMLPDRQKFIFLHRGIF